MAACAEGKYFQFVACLSVRDMTSEAGYFFMLEPNPLSPLCFSHCDELSVFLVPIDMTGKAELGRRQLSMVGRMTFQAGFFGLVPGEFILGDHFREVFTQFAGFPADLVAEILVTAHAGDAGQERIKSGEGQVLFRSMRHVTREAIHLFVHGVIFWSLLGAMTSQAQARSRDSQQMLLTSVGNVTLQAGSDSNLRCY